MLSKRLGELSKDTSSPESIAELVVTALGAGGSYYICWKTRAGCYEQDSYGLPKELQEWLFPQEGQGRDLATLQVILGPGDGEFFASDCNGKIEWKAAEPKLKRASTFAARKSWSDTSQPVSSSGVKEDCDASSRQRAATWDTYRRDSLLMGNSMSTRKAQYTLSDSNIRRISLAPTRIAPVKASSIDGTPDGPATTSVVHDVSSLGHGIHSSYEAWSNGMRSHLVSRPKRPVVPIRPRPSKQNPSYVNAGVQTDAEVMAEDRHPTTEHSNHNQQLSLSSASSFTGSDFFPRHSRRSSAATDITTDTLDPQGLLNSNNPVLIGRMQDYFRSSAYRLGDALEPR